jgi:hypothetical protein
VQNAYKLTGLAASVILNRSATICYARKAKVMV